jgi:hypothetical protein
MNTNIYHQVCSLGPFCHSANLLQRLNLKIVSFPFDWIFSNPLIIANCIETNFRFFLDKSYFMVDASANHQQNKYYVDHFHITNPLFPHSNPLHQETLEHFQRCIQRFHILLNCPDKKLFIISYMVTYTEKVDSDYIEKLKILNRILSVNTTNYDILCIINTPKQAVQSSVFSTLGENIIILELHTFSISHGVFFLNEDDNIFLQNIIRNKFAFDIQNIYTDVHK